MNLKKCTCCQIMLTTKSVAKLGRLPCGERDLLYLNCNACGSTVVMITPPIRQVSKPQIL